MRRGRYPCSIMYRFCLLLPIIRFLTLFVQSKRSLLFSENKFSRNDLNVSTSCNWERAQIRNLTLVRFYSRFLSAKEENARNFPPPRLCC